MIKKIFINVLIITILISLIYTKLLNFIGFFYNVIPDFFLILVVFNGVFSGSMYAMIFGFFSGLALDIATYPLVGFNALIYASLGYLTSIPEKKFEFENFITSGILILIFILIKAFLFLLVGSIFLQGEEITFFFKNVFIIQLVYTVIISVPIFIIYTKMSKILGSNKKNG